MNYKLKFHKQVFKFLEKCEINIANKFYQGIQIITKNPFSSELDIKKLKGKDNGAYRLRVGKYRFKYIVFKDEILVYFYYAGKRGDIYK